MAASKLTDRVQPGERTDEEDGGSGLVRDIIPPGQNLPGRSGGWLSGVFRLVSKECLLVFFAVRRWAVVRRRPVGVEFTAGEFTVTVFI